MVAPMHGAKKSRCRITSRRPLAHAGAGVPATPRSHRGLSPRGYDSTEPQRVTYNAYGKRTVWNATGTMPLNGSQFGFQKGFCGMYLDKETGLYYARFRMYSPTLGRFISRDPIGYIDGMSLYAGYFVPNYTDPSGLGLAEEIQKLVEEAKKLKEKGKNATEKEVEDHFGRRRFLADWYAQEHGVAGYLGEMYIDRLINDPTPAQSFNDGGSTGQVVGAAVAAAIITKGLSEKAADDSSSSEEACPSKTCLPCVPPAGTLGYTVVPPGARERGRHKQGGGADSGHVKYRQVHQTAYPDCKCFWNYAFTDEDTQATRPNSQLDPGGTTAGGGGPAP